jgi:hypothetical protein
LDIDAVEKNLFSRISGVKKWRGKFHAIFISCFAIREIVSASYLDQAPVLLFLTQHQSRAGQAQSR